MPISGGGPDPKVAERLAQLVELQATSLKWHWRALAISVAVASIVCAIFQVLTYLIIKSSL